MFESHVRSFVCTVAFLLCCSFAFGQTPTPAPAVSQADNDRPVLTRQPVSQPASATEEYTEYTRPAGPEVVPGLSLPGVGTVWVLDNFEGKPELVRLRYNSAEVNNHATSNVVKVNLAPFIYKPKITIELRDPKATVRLHHSEPVIFIRDPARANDDAAPGAAAASTHADWTLVALEQKKDRRIANKIAFTQITSNAKRSQGVVETVAERIGNTDWYKITPKQPLAQGEYGLMLQPRAQGLFTPQVFDFAIDPAAPANTELVRPK